ncbi:hypothetical protein ACQPUY_05805 [Clostridium nigeriense]|uniref:hypothetical protein n=1 Tax=Clostridium nigeriense TaxID=1805470 RepID=UPI003D325A75
MTKNYTSTKLRQDGNIMIRQILENLNRVYSGTLTIIKQDGYPIQYNLNEKFYSGEYLC